MTDRFKSESAGMPTGAPNTGVSYNQITVDLDPMLTGIGPSSTKPLFSLYKDIYYNDSVAGSAVDLISSLPFSEFTLGGISDPKIATTFNEVIERMNVRTLLPELSIDYLVYGAHVSSMLYNREKKVFTDVMCHALEHCSFEELPFYSQDPIITVDFTESAKTLRAKQDHPRIKRLVEMVGQTVVDSILKGSIELEPLNTLYIPRRTFSSGQLGTSFFKRILPIYLIEKNLFRGTLMESARRQRGIMHITAGDGDQWEPTEQDLEFITELFMNADSDPLGAIIATKMGIAIEEIRQGGDFWKVTDFQDSVMTHKYHALGISDGLLSGEANYNTADASLTVFIDMIRTYREMITRKFFYNKLFPLVSLINGYTVNAKGKVIQRDLLTELTGADLMTKLNDGSKLLIPTVNWAKQLKPEGDTAYMDMLNTLAEKGVPVPIRVLAAAGGLNLDELLRQSEDDIDNRKRISEYVKKISALAPKPAEGAEDESLSSDYANNEAAIALASSDPTGKVRSAVLAVGKGKVPILNRNFGSLSEVYATTKTGKRKAIYNQAAENERVNRLIARSAIKLNTLNAKR